MNSLELNNLVLKGRVKDIFKMRFICNVLDINTWFSFKYVYCSDIAICTYSHTEEGNNLAQFYGLTESL